MTCEPTFEVVLLILKTMLVDQRKEIRGASISIGLALLKSLQVFASHFTNELTTLFDEVSEMISRPPKITKDESADDQQLDFRIWSSAFRE